MAVSSERLVRENYDSVVILNSSSSGIYNVAGTTDTTWIEAGPNSAEIDLGTGDDYAVDGESSDHIHGGAGDDIVYWKNTSPGTKVTDDFVGDSGTDVLLTDLTFSDVETMTLEEINTDDTTNASIHSELSPLAHVTDPGEILLTLTLKNGSLATITDFEVIDFAGTSRDINQELIDLFNDFKSTNPTSDDSDNDDQLITGDGANEDTNTDTGTGSGSGGSDDESSNNNSQTDSNPELWEEPGFWIAVGTGISAMLVGWTVYEILSE